MNSSMSHNLDTHASGHARPLCRRASFRLPSSHAFTLTEILVVIGVIVLVLGLAAPLFNVITGSRSTEAGTNLVNSVLGQARSLAINTGTPTGVFVHVDPDNNRTRLTLVSLARSELDQLNQYKGNAGTGTTYNRPNRVTGEPGDQVLTGIIARSSRTWQIDRRPRYLLVEAQLDATNPTNQTVNPPPFSPNPWPQNDIEDPNPVRINTDWVEAAQQTLEIVPGYDPVSLPRGVGVQLVVNNYPTTARPAIWPANWDMNRGWGRYVGVGVIMFDGQGRVSSRPFKLGSTGPLADLLGLSDTSRIDPRHGMFRTPFEPAVGLVAFDLRQFLANERFTLDDMSFRFPIYADDGTVSPTNAPGNTESDNEIDEELWLDSNAVPLLLNRFSGTLVRTE